MHGAGRVGETYVSACIHDIIDLYSRLFLISEAVVGGYEAWQAGWLKREPLKERSSPW